MGNALTWMGESRWVVSRNTVEIDTTNALIATFSFNASKSPILVQCAFRDPHVAFFYEEGDLADPAPRCRARQSG